jgi:hypothetical protein
MFLRHVAIYLQVHRMALQPRSATSLSLMLKEEHRLRVFEKRVLRRTSGPKIQSFPCGGRD